MENLSTYIQHPEKLDRNTLYELRLIVGKYPYFDVARLLMLKNLYLLHDIDFGKEMRKAALYLKSRWPLFELMAGYGAVPAVEEVSGDIPVDRTMSLIDDFLSGDNERISLDLHAETPAVVQEAYEPHAREVASEPSFFTETLANIYIKQGKYDKALEIIKRLYLEFPNKNRYFADQIRFLEIIVKHTKKE